MALTSFQEEKMRTLFQEGKSASEIAFLMGVEICSVDNFKIRERFGSRANYLKYLAERKEKTGEENGEETPKRVTTGQYQKALRAEHQQRDANKELSELVTKRLEERGMNISEAAKMMGVRKQSFGLYVSGKTIPDGDNLYKLLMVLDIDIKELHYLRDRISVLDYIRFKREYKP